jgi:hypothetical protein
MSGGVLTQAHPGGRRFVTVLDPPSGILFGSNTGLLRRNMSCENPRKFL